MHKLFITTSRYPTPITRSFAKQLSMIISNASYIPRGKLTLAMLALQAIDLDISKIIIVKNRKGNPGYIDIYIVNHLEKSIIKLCSLHICGYLMNKTKYSSLSAHRSKYVILGVESIDSIDENILECIVTGFNIKIYKHITSLTHNMKNSIIIHIKKKMLKNIHSINPIYEITFKDCQGELIGPVLRICRAKIFTKLP